MRGTLCLPDWYILDFDMRLAKRKRECRDGILREQYKHFRMILLKHLKNFLALLFESDCLLSPVSHREEKAPLFQFLSSSEIMKLFVAIAVY